MMDMEIANAVMLGNNPPIHHDTSDAMSFSFLGTDFGSQTNANIPSLIQMVANPSLEIWIKMVSPNTLRVLYLQSI